MTVKLMTEHHVEFLSLKEGCTGWSDYTLVIMPHCWKSRVAAQMVQAAPWLGTPLKVLRARTDLRWHIMPCVWDVLIFVN